MKTQRGQTLIETLVAAFILSMGITAALGLANYSLRATTEIRQQIIALGLAREGLEVVKNMRDTNWLRGSLSPSCKNFTTGANNSALCYQNWLNGGGQNFQLNPPGTDTNYYLSLNTSPTQQLVWTLNKKPGNQTGYGLNYNPTNVANGIYSGTGNSVASSTSGFGRIITLYEDTSFTPFRPGEGYGGRLKVTSTVWWTRGRCPVVETPPTDSRCKITLETYLTNWKNY